MTMFEYVTSEQRNAEDLEAIVAALDEVRRAAERLSMEPRSVAGLIRDEVLAYDQEMRPVSDEERAYQLVKRAALLARALT